MGYASIKEGKYVARAISGEVSETKNGKPQITVTFEFNDSNGQPTTMTWFGSLSGGAIQYTMESLRACGWETDDVRDLRGIDANEVQITIKNEVWEVSKGGDGKARLKIKYVDKAGKIEITPMAMDKAAMFAEEMRAYAVQSRQAARATAPATAPATPVPAKASVGGLQVQPPRGPLSLSDDDIPFMFVLTGSLAATFYALGGLAWIV